MYTYSWCERQESGGDGERSREYELHRLVRELVRARFQNRFQDRFIQLVHDLFTGEGVHFTVKERYYPQLEEELGNRAGLAICRWNQGLIYQKEKNYRQQIKLWKQSIQINKELGIPTTEDEKALEKLLKEIG